MLNIQRVAFASLVLVPFPASAATEAGSPVPFLLPLLFAVLALLTAVCWLGLRLRLLLREKRDLNARLSLAEQCVDLTPLPILRLDADLRVIAANRRALDAYARPSLIGINLLELHPELAGHPVVAAVQSASAEGKLEASPLFPEPKPQESGGPGELTMLTAAGREAQILWAGTPSANQHPIPAASDVAALAEESASRMKSDFIANINHEVRTPMNAIIGYTEMLANSPLDPKEKRFVTIIHKSSIALVTIFNDIMELSKIDSGRLQIMSSTVRISSIINEVGGLFNTFAEEKGLYLFSRIAPHLPQSIRIDGVRLKQILQNLVSNAVKFTHEGSVTLLADGKPSPELPGCIDLRFTVEDTGIGIPEADQQKIFQLFRQREDVITKQYSGVGLGLTLCSRLAAMMGGRIELSSREGKGTRFIVIFDGVQIGDPAPSSPEPPAGLTVREGERKLLVVDDVDLIKDVFLDFFQDSPYRVLVANNGEEAVAVARAEQPGIIFMDLNLSGADGRSVTAELRRNPETAAIPVVVMTGEILEENDYRPLFDDFLQKPFRLETLRETVDRHIRPSPGRTEQPAEHDGGDEQLLALRSAKAWNGELELLRRQAVFSGSLAEAATLGEAMRQRGKAENQPVLTMLGEELLRHAHEPNILGVDRLLAKLSRITNATSHEQK